MNPHGGAQLCSKAEVAKGGGVLRNEGGFSQNVVPFRMRPVAGRDSGPRRVALAEGRVSAGLTRFILGMRLRLRSRRSAVSNAWRGRSWRPVARTIPVVILGTAATWAVLLTVGSWAAALVSAATFVSVVATLTSRRTVLAVPRSTERNVVHARSQSESLDLTPGRRPPGPWEERGFGNRDRREWSRRNL